MCGIGKYTFDDGDYHIGEYADDKKNGYGIMHYLSKNELYQGEYKNDKKNGFGEIVDTNTGKTKEKGKYEDNVLKNK